MSETVRIGLEKIKAAVDTRAEITERYKTYGVLSKIVQATALVEHADFKNSVDALYYLGGGWPSETSKGRMEKALDNFAGMYKILSLIGRGELVEQHLEKKGISVVLKESIKDVALSPVDIRLLNDEFEMSQFAFKATTLSALVAACVAEAKELQSFICEHADLIKLDFKPSAKNALQVEDEEYDRLVFMTKFKDKPERVVKKKNVIEGSISKFRNVVHTSV